jgi:hypothetical protein
MNSVKGISAGFFGGNESIPTTRWFRSGEIPFHPSVLDLAIPAEFIFAKDSHPLAGKRI